MKTLKTILFAMALMPILAFTSCSNDDDPQDVNVTGKWNYSSYDCKISATVPGMNAEQLNTVIAGIITQMAPYQQGTVTYFTTDGKIAITMQTATTASGAYQVTNANQVGITIQKTIEGDIPVAQQVTTTYTGSVNGNTLTLSLDKTALKAMIDKLPWNDNIPISKQAVKALLDLPVTTFSFKFIFTKA